MAGPCGRTCARKELTELASNGISESQFRGSKAAIATLRRYALFLLIVWLAVSILFGSWAWRYAPPAAYLALLGWLSLYSAPSVVALVWSHSKVTRTNHRRWQSPLIAAAIGGGAWSVVIALVATGSGMIHEAPMSSSDLVAGAIVSGAANAIVAWLLDR